MHPLAPDISKLSMEELLLKHNELTKRLQQAYRSGPFQVIPQIQMMMEHYQSEIGERNRKQMEEMTRKSQEGGYKGIIDIS